MMTAPHSWPHVEMVGRVGGEGDRREIARIDVRTQIMPRDAGGGLDGQDVLGGKGFSFVKPIPNGRLSNTQKTRHAPLPPNNLHRLMQPSER